MMLGLHNCIHITLIVSLAIVVHQYWQLRCAQFVRNRSTLADVVSSQPWIDQMTNTTDSLISSEYLASAISSVWCWGSHHTDRICQFHNLCYLASEGEFVFLHGPGSVYVGLPSSQHDPALLDMSSVRDHNMQYFHFMDVDATKLRSLYTSATVVNRTSLIFRRFHPDNLMHVLHDDLLPLYHTLRTLPNLMRQNDSDIFDVQLVFAEGWDQGPFKGIYEKFSIVKPLYKADLEAAKNLFCFKNAYVGLSKHTTWYQYGFFEPQGPIPDHNVTAYDIRGFCHYMRMHLNVTVAAEQADGRIAVIVVRKYNRLILNEIELTTALARSLHIKVLSVGIETHSFAEIISVISSASLLLGMHGSLLVLGLFLPPGSIIVELFPYAVNPAHYTPYQTLANIPGMELVYMSWRNMDISKSVAHPNRSWDEGGISHLPEPAQKKIMSSREVRRHLCCRDPEWLYRIYQDTVVDVDAVVSLIASVGVVHLEKTNISPPPISHKLFPSYVRNISCVGSGHLQGLPSLMISWQQPANVKFIDHKDVKYEVWIQENGKEDYTAWVLTKYEHTFTGGIQPSTNYSIWIRCILDEVTGPFNVNHILCSTNGILSD